MSLAENVAESTKQAENRPLSLKGLAVSTPKELESKVTGLLDNSDTESESPFASFSSIPTDQIKQVLGEPMVSSINGFFVELDTCLSVGCPRDKRTKVANWRTPYLSIRRCIEVGEGNQCYEWLTTKNAFKVSQKFIHYFNEFQAQGIAPFTTTIIGLSPLVAQVVNLVLTFEEVTNFVSISANLTALNSFGIDNIKVQVEDNQGRAGIVPMLFAKKMM